MLRFVGSDPGSDEVILLKILDVLKILILSKVGLLLTNESICEIMQSTLRYMKAYTAHPIILSCDVFMYICLKHSQSASSKYRPPLESLKCVL